MCIRDRLFHQQGLFLRQPADGRGVKNDFRPLHGRQARGFRVPLVPADENAAAAEFGVERLIAQVAGGEVEFFFKPGILRNMHPVSYTHLDVYKRQPKSI